MLSYLLQSRSSLTFSSQRIASQTITSKTAAQQSQNQRFSSGLSGWLRLLLLLGLCVAGTMSASAQGTTPIILTTNVVPPLDADLSVWVRNPERVNVTLQNTDITNSYSIRLGGFIEALDGSVSVAIKENYVGATEITLPPGNPHGQPAADRASQSERN